MMKWRDSEIVNSLEAQIATELMALVREVPVGAQLVVSPSDDLCYALELYIPILLRRQYPEWEKESLDGIFVAFARKTGETRIELVGTCILITDQTVTPFFAVIESNVTGDSIISFRLSLGEQGRGLLGVSGPICNSPEAGVLLRTLKQRLTSMEWSYSIVSDDSGIHDQWGDVCRE